jgi:DNA-binding transcriptional LysR family regulator
VHALKSPTNIWTFMGEKLSQTQEASRGEALRGKTSVRVNGSIRANYGDPLRHAALLGHGISMHPTYMVMQDIQEGRLVSVLPQFRPVGVDIYAVFPSRKNLPVRVRTFLDFLRQWFAAADWHAYQNVP